MPGLREHVLDDVFGVARVTDNPQHQRVDQPRMPVVQLGERSRVAGRNTRDHGAIARAILSRGVRAVDDGEQPEHPMRIIRRREGNGCRPLRKRCCEIDTGRFW
jgi:hypothetical protein